jgi:pyruvate formate lyase activating enzyme
VSGRLNTLIYNSLSSATPDPIEKKPLYHFHPGTYVFSLGTIGCNFKCKHCQNRSISFAKFGEFNPMEMSADESVKGAICSNCDGIAWTYNEPTIWFEYTYDGARLTKGAGVEYVYLGNSMHIDMRILTARNVEGRSISWIKKKMNYQLLSASIPL